MKSRQKSHVRLIKRYGNRKLYDVDASRYVTLHGIQALVQAGEDVSVVDNDTGEDLTGVTLAQIIYEAERRADGVLSLPLLRRLVQFGDDTMRDFRRGVERGREAFESVREAAGQRVQELVGGRGQQRGGLLEELLDVPQRHLDDLQQRIDAQVRQSVERVTGHPKLQSEIKRVERSLRKLEKRLSQIARTTGGRRKPTPRGARRRKKRVTP